MNLFINAISKNAYLALFNEEREILKDKIFEIKWNESSLFLPAIDTFLKENKLSFWDLKNIVVVNWPWSFTGVRTIVLAVNTISFVVNNWQLTTKHWPLNLTSLSYFDLFKDFPIIKASSKRDSFFKKDENSQIEIIYNDELTNRLKSENIEVLYWEWDLKNVEIIEKINYCDIIKNIELKKNSKIEALYVKKPNIC